VSCSCSEAAWCLWWQRMRSEFLRLGRSHKPCPPLTAHVSWRSGGDDGPQLGRGHTRNRRASGAR
jgi:hypothetical protein